MEFPWRAPPPLTTDQGENITQSELAQPTLHDASKLPCGCPSLYTYYDGPDLQDLDRLDVSPEQLKAYKLAKLRAVYRFLTDGASSGKSQRDPAQGIPGGRQERALETDKDEALGIGSDADEDMPDLEEVIDSDESELSDESEQFDETDEHLLSIFDQQFESITRPALTGKQSSAKQKL